MTLPAAADQVSALALAHGDIVLSAQADNDSLQSYHLQADGSLVLRDSYGAADGIGIDAPTALVTASQGADSYAILAAARQRQPERGAGGARRQPDPGGSYSRQRQQPFSECRRGRGDPERRLDAGGGG